MMDDKVIVTNKLTFPLFHVGYQFIHHGSLDNQTSW